MRLLVSSLLLVVALAALSPAVAAEHGIKAEVKANFDDLEKKSLARFERSPVDLQCRCAADRLHERHSVEQIQQGNRRPTRPRQTQRAVGVS